MQAAGKVGFSGDLGIRHIIRPPIKAPMSWRIRNKTRKQYVLGLIGKKIVIPLARMTGVSTMQSELSLVHIDSQGRRTDYGVVDRHLVTTAFVNYMVDILQVEAAAWGDFKFHDSGIGVTNPNITDTDIETTDQESRATGSQTEGASANIYKSVGTIAYTNTLAITEHGLFSSAASTTLMDRHEFAAVNVVNGESIEYTYQLTCTAGG